LQSSEQKNGRATENRCPALFRWVVPSQLEPVTRFYFSPTGRIVFQGVLHEKLPMDRGPDLGGQSRGLGRHHADVSADVVRDFALRVSWLGLWFRKVRIPD